MVDDYAKRGEMFPVDWIGADEAKRLVRELGLD